MNAQTDTPKAPDATISSFLAEPLRVGDPGVSGPPAVFPILGPEPRLLATEGTGGNSFDWETSPHTGKEQQR